MVQFYNASLSTCLLSNVCLDFGSRCAVLHDKEDSCPAVPIVNSQAFEVDGEIFEVDGDEMHGPYRPFASPVSWYLDIRIFPWPTRLQKKPFSVR